MKHIYNKPVSEKDKKRFAKYLSEDEQLVLATGYGALYMRQKFIIFLAWPGFLFWFGIIGLAYYLKWDLIAATLIGFFVAIIVALIKSYMTYNAHRYLLTTRRVIVKGGYFSVKLTSALYDKITHIEVDQNFVDRWVMHHGTIIINTAGMSRDEIELDNVDNPVEFKNVLERLIHREREYFSRGKSSSLREDDVVEGELVED